MSTTKTLTVVQLLILTTAAQRVDRRVLPLPSAAPLALSNQLQERLAALVDLDLEQLRTEWQRLYRSAPPLRLS